MSSVGPIDADDPHMPSRSLAPVIAVAAAAGSLLAGSSGAHRLPQAPKCPVLPASNAFNQRVDRWPVAANSATLVRSIGMDASAHPDFGSGTYDGRPIGIPYTVVGRTQRRVPVTFDYAD